MSLFFLAIAAGFLTILAPCILPVLPFLLGTSGGRSKWRPVMIIVGFVGSFTLIGAALATAGTFLGISNDNLRILAGVLLILFGAALFFEKAYEQLAIRLQPALAKLGANVAHGSATKSDAMSGLLVGFSLGLVWSPCAGPILGTILTLAARSADYVTTALLFFAYALGAGIPMLGIAYGSHRLQERLRSVGHLQPILNKIFGALVILTAIAILTGYDRVAQAWLVERFPLESILKL
ncbi:MAG: cytochrome c biogenesis CcdA family protein [Patescibacteria group bacterium]|nr:MAG: cytochrome c biogenesis CcdA family protein [Patescibacteria group bacterium]